MQLENTNQTRMNTEQLKELYKQQIADMMQNRVAILTDQTRVIPLRRGALIIYGDDLVDEDDYNSSYTEESSSEEKETSNEMSDTEDYAEEDESSDDASDGLDWLVDIVIQEQDRIQEEENKDIKSVERQVNKVKKVAK